MVTLIIDRLAVACVAISVFFIYQTPPATPQLCKRTSVTTLLISISPVDDKFR
jgi:hypothetical protein